MPLSYGFTLIELIVVIAILAILALIAIPRLAGFTNKAKEANDKELGSIIAHSLQTLIASGDLDYNNATASIEITGASTLALNIASGTLDDKLGTGGTTYTNGTLLAKLTRLIGSGKYLQRATRITINITNDGEIPIETNVVCAFPTN